MEDDCGKLVVSNLVGWRNMFVPPPLDSHLHRCLHFVDDGSVLVGRQVLTGYFGSWGPNIGDFCEGVEHNLNGLRKVVGSLSSSG